MKKSVLLLLLVLMSLGTTVWGQWDAKIETGIIAHIDNDFKKAITYLDEGLAHKAELKPKNVPRGFWYRGDARVKLMREFLMAKGKDATEEDAKIAKNMLMGAYADFKESKATDDGKWAKKVETSLKDMNNLFLGGALGAIGVAYKKETPDADKLEAFKGVIEFLNLSVEIDATNYIAFDLRGQAKLGLKDSLDALPDFVTAAKLVEGNTHTQPDLLIGYIYYRKALIERYKQGNIDGALSTIDKGRKVLDIEWAKIVAKKAEMKPEKFAELEKNYNDYKDDLSKFELDLLLNAPEKLQEAIDKFKAQIAKEPKNAVLYIAYGQLLEKVEKLDEAAAAYEKATTVDPAKQDGWYSLGALYTNQGVKLYTDANKMEDFNKAKEMQTKGDELFKKALPNLQKALELNKCDRQVLKALLQITINLQMTDEYKKYKDQEKACDAGQ